MSGGSFNYLYAKSATDALGTEDFERALGIISTYDHEGAREATAVMTEMLRISKVLGRRWERLSQVLYALEWWHSADTSEESFRKACQRYFEEGT